MIEDWSLDQTAAKMSGAAPGVLSRSSDGQVTHSRGSEWREALARPGRSCPPLALLGEGGHQHRQKEGALLRPHPLGLGA